MSVSAAPLSAGSIRIEIGVDAADGATRRVRLASSRPTGFSARLFSGRTATDVPGLVARMHALCGRSHMVAAEMAIVAAIGRDPEAVLAERFESLVAERLGEHLRSTVTAETGRGGTLHRETLADVRAVLAGCRLLAGGRDPQRGFEAAKAIDGIGEAVARLGLAIDRKGRLATATGSWAQSALGEAGPVTGDRFAECDRLTEADDAEVIAGLARDPDGFSASPRLSGRRPETGPAARAARGTATADGRLRRSARLAEIAEAAGLLAADTGDHDDHRRTWAQAARVETLTGYAAVESPRGRLHHLVRLDERGQVASWAILAPTEWNFHADGPLVRTLSVNRFPVSPEGRMRAERIAALFDPCVGFEVAIEETRDA